MVRFILERGETDMKKIDSYVESMEDVALLSEIAGHLLRLAHYSEPWNYEFSMVIHGDFVNIDYGMKGIARYCERRHPLGKSDDLINRSVCRFRDMLHNCGKDFGKISFEAQLVAVDPNLKKGLRALRVHSIVLYEK